MESSRNTGAKTTNIPRLSRLPLPNGIGKISGHTSDIKDTLTSVDQRLERLQNRLQAPKSGTLSLSKPGTARNGISSHGSTNDSKPLAAANTARRKPRPSLSDRTMETLSQIPPSPSPRRRKSSFFVSESPMASPIRPASSLSRSRPSTSHGNRPPLPPVFPSSRPASPTKRQLAPTSGNQTPVKRSSVLAKRASSACVTRNLPLPLSKADNARSISPSKSRPHYVGKTTSMGSPPAEAAPKSQSNVVRGKKPLGSAPPSTPSKGEAIEKPTPVTKSIIKTIHKRPVSSIKDRQKVPPSAQENLSFQSLEPVESTSTPPKSSAALRETIAKAKAARRQATRPQAKDLIGVELSDQWEMSRENDRGGGMLKRRITSARTDGRLNIAAMGLEGIPSDVKHMYDMDTLESDDGAWYESVDLVKLVAADNAIESLGDEYFPENPMECQESDTDYQGNLFAGLQSIDVHGNLLHSLPQGLRALQQLTYLNLSKNRLQISSLAIINHIETLRELRMGGNALDGDLDDKLSNLRNLKLLDLSNNTITHLPHCFSALPALRCLTMAGNKLESLPLSLFLDIPLSDLDVSRNRIKGSLFPPDVVNLSDMKALDVSSNAISSLSESGPLIMTSLHTLNVAENRIKALPDISEWINLSTLIAAGNQISFLPVGLTHSKTLRNVDLARNDIKSLDAEIGLMDSLTVFSIANNPLRERRLLNMNTEHLKDELRFRLSTEDPTNAEEAEQNSSAYNTNTSQSTSSEVLDLSSSNLLNIDFVDLGLIVQSHAIKSIKLHHNCIREVPPSLTCTSSSLVSLELSHNKLFGEGYLPAAMSLQNLRKLDLSVNTITSLTPLRELLSAPSLVELNISRNRLSALELLRDRYPSLTSVSASDNVITSIDIEAARGLHVLDLSNNSIGHLDPRLGLLGPAGLRMLLVGGNTFRVPKRDIIEKGTESILAWLKGRIPEDDYQGPI